MNEVMELRLLKRNELGRVGPSKFIKVTAVAMQFSEGMTQEEWLETGRFLRNARLAVDYWQADWTRFGAKKWGQKFVESAIEQLEFDLEDATRSALIGELPESIRRWQLTSEHHYVVVKAELDEKEADKWLGLAVEHKLNALELQRSIRAGEIITDKEAAKEIGRNSGFATIEGCRFLFERWFRRVEERDPIESWDRERKIRLLEEIKPIVELGEKLKATV